MERNKHKKGMLLTRHAFPFFSNFYLLFVLFFKRDIYCFAYEKIFLCLCGCEAILLLSFQENLQVADVATRLVTIGSGHNEIVEA